jgi:ubiquinone/menaquinone biosynthesis C-methylase UbiE
VWQYTRANYIAGNYDEYFALNRLFEFDRQVLARYFRRPGFVVDLGCGTGRTLIDLARRGCSGLGVDLSPAMLRITAEKVRRQELPVRLIRANLVELDCLRSESADYVTCMFSTLGMIQGRENRHRVLTHARRILKPEGLFVVHVHNFWYNLFDPAGRAWLRRHLPAVLFRRPIERGDKYFHYRGVPRMFLHTFTQGELIRELRRAGFHLQELIRLDADRQRPLRCAWWLGSIRANGWIAVCG